MKIIIVLIFCIFFCPPLTTQDDAGVKNQIICNIAGRVWRSTYVFDISILPERCDIIDIGQYAFDRDNGVDTHMMESDKDIIRSLVEANKPVYTRIGFDGTDDWASIFNPPDANVFQTKKFDPLVNFLIQFKVNGLIINSANIYNIGIDCVAQKISDFVCEIKKKVDKLIVGLMFSGSFYESFTDITLFDFTITNKMLDLYIIDWSILNNCDKDAVKTGISPVTSTNPNTITIEKVTSSVTNSSMEKSKIYGMVQMVPNIPLNLLSNDATYSITTINLTWNRRSVYPHDNLVYIMRTNCDKYFQSEHIIKPLILPPLGIMIWRNYCSSTDKANSSQWCTNPSQLSYDQGVHAKKFYAGIVLDQLDTDDYESKCECGPFPVTNIVLDGWSGCPFKACPKLDQN